MPPPAEPYQFRNPPIPAIQVVDPRAGDAGEAAERRDSRPQEADEEEEEEEEEADYRRLETATSRCCPWLSSKLLISTAVYWLTNVVVRKR